jgi:hypothetical protein
MSILHEISDGPLRRLVVCRIRLPVKRALLAALVVALGSSGACSKKPKEKTTAGSKESTTTQQAAEDNTDAPVGLWNVARKPEAELTAEDREKMDKLQALPYLGGYELAPDSSNVTLYDPDRAYNGYNLYNSGHFPEAVLMDMDGKVLKRWSYELDAIWPDAPRRKMAYYWRRLYLYPNGDLLAIFDSYGMLKLDKDSNLIWALTAKCHHDLDVTADGTIYTLIRRPEVYDGYNDGNPVLPDAIAVVSSDGRLLETHWLIDSFKNSPKYSYMLQWIPRDVQDVLHANSVRVFDGSMERASPLYKKGNILFSLRQLDVVGILDPVKDEIIWAESGIENGLWRGQHDPTLLPNGHMLLFDNRGRSKRETSKIIEFDPFTLDVAWEYPGVDQPPIYSKVMGAVKRLPNGNTLISESNFGRALEVTPDKRIVWEFLNPNRAGDQNELIATLFEVKRIDYDYVKFLDREDAGGAR